MGGTRGSIRRRRHSTMTMNGTNEVSVGRRRIVQRDFMRQRRNNSKIGLLEFRINSALCFDSLGKLENLYASVTLLSFLRCFLPERCRSKLMEQRQETLHSAQRKDESARDVIVEGNVGKV